MRAARLEFAGHPRSDRRHRWFRDTLNLAVADLVRPNCVRSVSLARSANPFQRALASRTVVTDIWRLLAR